MAIVLKTGDCTKFKRIIEKRDYSIIWTKKIVSNIQLPVPIKGH